MCKALLSKPAFFLPTIWATIESVLFSELNFQEPHGGRGIANAFRHAAWNLLIARNCSAFTTTEQSIDWAKTITDFHEECFPNEEFDREMDLHNNRIGRDFYRSIAHQKLSKLEMITQLMDKSKSAIGTQNLEEIKKKPQELIFYVESSSDLI